MNNTQKILVETFVKASLLMRMKPEAIHRDLTRIWGGSHRAHNIAQGVMINHALDVIRSDFKKSPRLNKAVKVAA